MTIFTFSENVNIVTVGKTLLNFTTQIDPLQLQPIFNKAGLQLLTRLHFERLYYVGPWIGKILCWSLDRQNWTLAHLYRYPGTCYVAVHQLLGVNLQDGALYRPNSPFFLLLVFVAVGGLPS